MHSCEPFCIPTCVAAHLATHRYACLQSWVQRNITAISTRCTIYLHSWVVAGERVSFSMLPWILEKLVVYCIMYCIWEENIVRKPSNNWNTYPKLLFIFKLRKEMICRILMAFCGYVWALHFLADFVTTFTWRGANRKLEGKLEQHFSVALTRAKHERWLLGSRGVLLGFCDLALGVLWHAT